MNANEEFIQEFLIECEENLDQLDQDLVALEEQPRDPSLLASIFRTIHTIKGTSGFFGYAKLGAVTHAGENLLGRLRDGELVLNPEITDVLLQLVDTVRQILAAIEQTREEGEGDHTPLIEKLDLLAAQQAVELAGQPPEPMEEEPEAPSDQSLASATAKLERDDVPASESLAEVVDQEDSSGEFDAGAAEDAMADESSPAAAESADEATLSEQVESEEAESPAQAEQARPVASQGTVRVDVGLLDELMNQVGELVLARNQIRPFADSIQDRVFGNALQQLDLITGDLQEGIMRTRMQPIGHLWGRLPRIVRDLAHAKGKQVQLELQGRDTELDRTLLEAIKDPLTHLVRNAVDHGIELPNDRVAVGKPPMGTVVLKAYHEGGLVNIEISDDGAGIDADRILDKAQRHGLVSSKQARRMTTQQITQLIFLPGLSTAERVTDISGRGVGMDVVKTNIERIGGSVSIDSQPGRGTTLRVKIPLTLAIIPVLMVGAGGQRYAIPQVSLREVITLFGGSDSRSIESIGSAKVYRLRGELLPLIGLEDVLQIASRAEEAAEEFQHIVVLEAIGQRFGLIVDQIARSEEIVVKPLHKTLAQIPLFSGATVLGDGQVALILDVAGVARTVGIEQRQAVELDDAGEDDDTWGRTTSVHGDFLVCEAAPGRRVAVALGDVARLEEFAARELQESGGQAVIPYGGQLMPLLQLDGYTTMSDFIEPLIYVVVHQVDSRYIGLMMYRIVDVAAAEQAIDTSQKRVGAAGRVLIDGQVLEVIDILQQARTVGIDLATGSTSEVAS